MGSKYGSASPINEEAEATDAGHTIHDVVRAIVENDEPPPRSVPKLLISNDRDSGSTPTPTAPVALTPAEAKAEAMAPQPAQPQPPGELSTTERFLLWEGAGGWGRRGSDWGSI
jgi:hypothetical protein